jgi:hypothetical protein
MCQSAFGDLRRPDHPQPFQGRDSLKMAQAIIGDGACGKRQRLNLFEFRDGS